MDFEEKTRRNDKKYVKRPLLDAIVRAVAAGIFIVSILLNLVFLCIIVIMGITASGGGRAQYFMGYKKIYTERAASARRGERADEIALVSISGIITEYDTRDGWLGYRENPSSGVKNRLKIIKSDPNIKGVLLVIESPGGGVTASDVLYHTIRTFKEETGMPVVALIKQIAASGGYYVASAADVIVAYPTAITGSIGVIMYNFNFRGLMDKYGVEYVAVKSSKNKDAMSPFKPIDEEELSWMQNIVDQMLDRFIDAVSQGRKNLTEEEVRALANGKIYIAQDALRYGLIDKIGYYEDAVRIISDKAGVKFPRIVEFERERSLRDIIGRVLFALPGILDRSLIKDFTVQERGVKSFELYYLWDRTFSIQ